MTQNEPRSYYAYVQNNGKTPVTSFTLSTNSKTASQTVKKELKFEGLNIPNNVPQKLKLDGIAIPVEGNVTTDFTISEVNGDNREAYRKLIVQLCRKISSQLSIVNQKGGQMPSLSSTVN